MLELAETPGGKKQLGVYIMRARVAYGAQSVMELLGVVPDAKTQQAVCETFYNVIFRVDIDDVMAWIDELKEFKNTNPDQFDKLPLC